MLVLGAGSGPLQPPCGAAALGALPRRAPAGSKTLARGGKALFGVGTLMQPALQHLLGARSWPLLPKRPLPTARCCTTCSVLGKSALFIAQVKGD